MPNVVDATTQATPMTLMQLGEEVPYNLKQLIVGNIPGSIGESSAILIVLAAIYLIYKKTASWKIMVSTSIGMLGIESIFSLMGISNFSNPFMAILSGGFLLAVVFMATDPVTAPSQGNVKIIFGLLIGIIASVIRSYSVFPEGVMFAILIVNSFVPLMDSIAKNTRIKGKKVTI